MITRVQYIVTQTAERITRQVSPYVHVFTTFAKQRWLGKGILDVLSSEFGSYSIDYWKVAIQHGFIRINGITVSPEYKFQSNDKLIHKTHRHEATAFGEVQIIGQTDTLIAVNKPPSIPMQPSGSYRYNSLEYILLYDEALKLKIHDMESLHVVHRLDRVTSGLVILAKSKDAAAEISKNIRDKKMKKVYLARVKGCFGSNLSHLKALDSINFRSFDTDDSDMKRGREQRRPHEIKQVGKESY
mmetsp:Transcript_18368/g.26480  ORF Transcript_18368/g.26480 Transcript_18368/m.26480 type:complete len:243 (+) Transcript_18368:2-730(+)